MQRSKTHSKYILLAALLLFFLGMSTISVPRAHAAIGDCDTGDACVWRDSGFKTNGYGRGWVAFEYDINNYSAYFYNGFAHTSQYNAGRSASSLVNNGRYSRACFYDSYNWTMQNPKDSPWCFAPKGGNKSNLQWTGWNDTILSGTFV